VINERGSQIEKARFTQASRSWGKIAKTLEVEPGELLKLPSLRAVRGDKMMLSNAGSGWMVEGSPPRLLRDYNQLVESYNRGANI